MTSGGDLTALCLGLLTCQVGRMAAPQEGAVQIDVLMHVRCGFSVPHAVGSGEVPAIVVVVILYKCCDCCFIQPVSVPSRRAVWWHLSPGCAWIPCPGPTAGYMVVSNPHSSAYAWE